MKRYLCEKSIEMLSLVGINGSNGQIAFQQGKVYPSGDKHVKDEFNNTWSVNHPKIAESLKELPPIDDVPNDEAYVEDKDKYELAARGISRWLKVTIAIIISILAIAYQIFA